MRSCSTRSNRPLAPRCGPTGCTSRSRAWRRSWTPACWTGWRSPTGRWWPAPRWPSPGGDRRRGRLRRAADPGPLEHGGVDPELPPGRVGDALAGAVGPGRLHELLLELGEVHLGLGRLQLALEVEALLDQLEPLEGVGLGQLLFDLGQSLLDRFRRPLASTPRLVGFERLKIAPTGTALISALGQRGLVLLGLGVSGLLGGHVAQPIRRLHPPLICCSPGAAWVPDVTSDPTALGGPSWSAPPPAPPRLRPWPAPAPTPPRSRCTGPSGSPTTKPRRSPASSGASPT